MVQVIQHPILKNSLATLRDKSSNTETFRIALRKASDLLAAYSLADLPIVQRQVHTPITSCTAEVIDEKNIILIPILRAGLAFVESFIHFLPNAIVGHIGLARDHETLESKQYYEKLPAQFGDKLVYILDPMLATGNSCYAAYQRLLEKGVKNCTVVSLLAAPEGITYLSEKAPELKIITASIDQKLNEKGYIVPGLGDAGDRFFGI